LTGIGLIPVNTVNIYLLVLQLRKAKVLKGRPPIKRKDLIAQVFSFLSMVKISG
jgi:hypothetical protein